MVILISLATAIIFGSGDFCGGLAARRATVIQVVAGSHAVGLAGVLAVSVAVRSSPTTADLGLGVLAGLFGGTAVGLLYRRLAVGPMHVVAPLTAITSAVVPSVWGVVLGERLASQAWVGIALALVAIGLVSSSSAASEHVPVTAQVVVESLLAGCGFGLMFVVFDATDPASAPWPVVSARVFTTAALFTFLFAAKVVKPNVERGLPSDSGTWRLIVFTGLLDTMANVGFLYATARGALAIVAVLTSLYPVATVVLARWLLQERMTSNQRWGFVGAMAATGLIAAA